MKIRRSRHVASFFVLVALAGSFLVLPAQIAEAVSCPLPEHFFIYDPTNDSHAWGQATNNYIREIALDPNCSTFRRVGTAHIRDCLMSGCGLVEVGWWRDGSSGFNYTWWFYYVRKANGSTIGPVFFFTGFGNVVNTWFRFKVNHVDWTNTWRVYVDDDLNGASPTELSPAEGLDAGFPNGVPMGEMDRVGNVTAYDHHANLWTRLNVGTWRKWGDQAKERDEVVGYHWHQMYTEYLIHEPESQHSN